MGSEAGAALAAALALAAIHVVAGRLRFMAVIPRSRWLSLAGGISVAYVMVEVLPSLAEGQETIEDPAQGLLPFLEHHVYLLALVGLSVFYTVERLSHRSRASGVESGRDHTSSGVFWLSISSFAIYNSIIGYLLLDHAEDSGMQLALFAMALGVHLFVNDFGLQEHHKRGYTEVGRWLLAAAIVVGWLLGELMRIAQEPIALMLAFIAGGVILNVIKEELPSERQSRLLPFAGGMGGYAALLQLV